MREGGGEGAREEGSRQLQCGSHLSKTDKGGENESPESHTYNTVDKISTKHREDHIGPGVEGVQESILRH